MVVGGADRGPFSTEFHAPARLYALLMQMTERAYQSGLASEVLIQTRFGQHPLFDALARHDFAAFADAQLAERHQAGLPPFMHQALMRVEARQLDTALAFLGQARELAADPPAGLTLFDPVPMPMARLAGRERAQLLLEAPARGPLHAFLRQWLPAVAGLKGAVRWQIEIDPLEI